MSLPKHKRRRVRHRGMTTPRSNPQPIRVVGAYDSICFRPRPADRAPFDKYPLPAGEAVMIEYQIVNKDGSLGDRGSFAYTGAADGGTDIALTREDYLEAKTLWVWASPLGHAALYGPSKLADFGYGRLSYDVTSVPPPAKGTVTGYVDLWVMESVAWFIVNEMNTNKRSGVIAECKRLNEEAEEKEAEAAGYLRQVGADPWGSESGELMDKAQAAVDEANTKRSMALRAFAGKVRTNNPDSWKTTVAWFLFGGDGSWDHKPIIKPVWGTDNRLGGVEHSVYYDIWSNIHFGYVGRAGGFSAQTLQDGADLQNLLDSGSVDGQVDREAVRAGFDLYHEGRDVTVNEVVNVVEAHAGWHTSARKAK